MSEKKSFYQRVFGSGKKGEKTSSPQEAIQRLREIEEMLMKKSEFLEKKVDSELATAKKNGTKNKRVALQALKRKKRYEKQLQQIDGTLSTIEFQRECLENATTNTEVLNAMGSAAKALKGAHNNMDVDKVHELMEDVAEQQDIANEISDAISNPVGFNTEFDDDDLELELEELEQEDLDEKLLDIDPLSDNLPSVPTSEPVTKKVVASTEEDDELAQLEAWAS